MRPGISQLTAPRGAAAFQQRDAHAASRGSSAQRASPQRKLSRATRRGRNSTPSVRPHSAASCRRRSIARLRLPRPGERRVAGPRAQHLLESPQRARACHDGHPLEHHAVRDERRGEGNQRRATHTHQRAQRARVSAASAGSNNDSSPLPKRETRISIRPRARPASAGKCSSSARKPARRARVRCATLRPRQMAGCSSRRASCVSPSPCSYGQIVVRFLIVLAHAARSHAPVGAARGAPPPPRSPR